MKKILVFILCAGILIIPFFTVSKYNDFVVNYGECSFEQQYINTYSDKLTSDEKMNKQYLDIISEQTNVITEVGPIRWYDYWNYKKATKYEDLSKKLIKINFEYDKLEKSLQ